MNLKTHINNVHFSKLCTKKSVHEKLKNYKCDLCDKKFSRSEHHKKHIASVHERQKNHKCELCTKAFSDLGALKNHITKKHNSTVSKLWVKKQANIVIKFVNRSYNPKKNST